MSSNNQGDAGGEKQRASDSREPPEEQGTMASSSIGPLTQAEQEMVLRQRQFQAQAQQHPQQPYQQAQQQQPAQPLPFSPPRGGAAMLPPSNNPMMNVPPELRYIQEMRRAEELFAQQQPPQQQQRPPYAAAAPPGMSYKQPPFSPGNVLPAAFPRGAPMNPAAVQQSPPNMQYYNSLMLQQQREEEMKRGAEAMGLSPQPDKKQRIEQQPPQMWMPQNKEIIMPVGIKMPKERKRHVKTFPVKLMEAINDYYDEAAVAWLPDGKSFVVVDPDLFCSLILTNAFKGGKYSSFVRKLNRWGFTRLISGTGTDCFHHALFQRGRMDLCAKIRSGPISPLALQAAGGSTKPSLAGVEKYFKVSATATAPGEKQEGTTGEEDGKPAAKK